MSDLANRTIKNSLYSFIGFIWPMALAFIVMPLLINKLGTSKYGFYVLLNASLSIFSLLDFGFNYTFVKKLSEEPGSKTKDEISRVFSSTFILYFLLGIFVFFLLSLLPDFFREVFKIPDGFVSSYKLAFTFLGVAFFFRMIVSPLIQIPYAMQRMGIMAKVSLINITFLQVSNIIAVCLGYGVMSLIVLQALSAIFLFVAYFYVWKKLMPDLKFVCFFSFNIFKGMMKDGFWVFASNVMSSALTQFDKFVMSAFWGPTSVSFYTSAQMIPEKIQATSFSLSVSLFPVFSNVSFLKDTEKLKNIFHRSVKIIILVSISLATMVLIYGYLLLKYWLGQEFADNSTTAMYILAVTYFLFAVNIFVQFYLSGTRKLKFIALSTLMMVVLDISFVFLLVPLYQINGAALAYLISMLPIPFILFYVEKKMLDFSLRSIIYFYTSNLSKIFLVASVVFVFSRLILVQLVTNLFTVILFGGVSLVLFFGLFRFFGFFEKEELTLFNVFLKKIFRLKYGK